ncbi:hypothetical protein PM082_002337 [Marasmius tenuissimus]|nr:hypothetical protein PM082_002337 [Marasmius tenuissimus]
MQCPPDCEGRCRREHLLPPYPLPFKQGDKAPCFCLDTWIRHLDPYEPTVYSDTIRDAFGIPTAWDSLGIANVAAMVSIINEIIPNLDNKVICPETRTVHLYSTEVTSQVVDGASYPTAHIPRKDLTNTSCSCSPTLETFSWHQSSCILSARDLIVDAREWDRIGFFGARSYS